MSAMQYITNLILSRTFALLIVITGAAWLRFFHLGDWSLWLDEALTVSDTLYVFKGLSLWQAIHFRPLNFWLTGWMFSVLPVSEWSARLVPCLVGVITIPVLYYISREFLGNIAAMLSSTLLALSTWHIYWSQNARGFALLLFFSMISMGLFYSGLEKGNRIHLLGSLVALGIAYLAHPVALFMLLAYCGYLVLIPLTGFVRPPGYTASVLSVFCIPLALVVALTLPGLAGLAGKVLSTYRSGGNPFYVFASVAYYVQPVFMVLGSAGVGILLFRRDRLGLFLGSLMVVPLVSLLALSAVRGGSAVYVFHSLPVYYIAATVVLTEIIRMNHAKALGLGLAVIIALFALQAGRTFEYFTYQYGDRPRWKEATEYVATAANSGDVIASGAAPVVDYYLGSRAFKLRKPEKVVWFGKFFRQHRNENFPNHGRSAWLLLTRDRINGAHQSGRLKIWLESHCGIMRIFEAWTSAKNRSVLVYRCST